MLSRALLAGLALGAGATALLLTTGVFSPPPASMSSPVVQECRASGAKHLNAPVSDTEACARFMAGIAALPNITGVELKILPQGVLSAIVTHAGTRESPSDYGLAVSDRAMTGADLDRLAAQVVADLAAPAPR